MKNNLKNGQVGLVLLVIMGVVIALAMSVASRSLSDTVLSRQERESSAAFSVAETGVENALNSLSQGQVPDGVVNLPVSLGVVNGQYEVKPTTTYALYVHEGETANLDLTTFVPTLNISWTRKADVSENPSNCDEGSGLAPAGIEITAVSGTAVNRAYYNPYGCNPGPNGFATSNDGGSTYLSSVSYTVPTTPSNATIIRIKPLYSGATILVSGAGLKDQLYLIQSKATGGDAQKEIEVRRGLDAPPSIFDYAVFSAGTIVK